MGERTIQDLGSQWGKFDKNYQDSYLGSTDHLADTVGPLLDLEELKGKRVADIGSGTGRTVDMLLDAGAESVIAAEPSTAFEALQANTEMREDRIEYVHGVAEAIPARRDLDYVFSIGVLHHIENPAAAVRAAYEALKPGGEFIVWLYGREGNRLYLTLVAPLRWLGPRCPDSLLSIVTAILDYCLDPYILLAKWVPMPMRDYLLNVYCKLSRKQRRINLFDQLNPTYAKYYNKDEAHPLLAKGGFVQIELSHRFGYSWAVIGRKPLPIPH